MLLIIIMPEADNVLELVRSSVTYQLGSLFITILFIWAAQRTLAKFSHAWPVCLCRINLGPVIGRIWFLLFIDKIAMENNDAILFQFIPWKSTMVNSDDSLQISALLYL